MTSAQADEASEKYGEYFSRQGIFENKLYAGIPELLSALQAQGATLAIATSKPDFLAERIAGISGSATVSRSSAAERPTVPARPKRA